MNQKISWSHSVFRSVRLATDFHRTRFGNRRLQVLSLMVNHLLQIETDLDFDCSPSSNKLEFLLVRRNRRLAGGVLLRKMEDEGVDFLTVSSLHYFHPSRRNFFFRLLCN